MPGKKPIYRYKNCEHCGKRFRLKKKGQRFCSENCVKAHSFAGAGRPTVVDDEVIKKLEEVFSIGGSVGEACFYADISEETYYYFVKKWPFYHACVLSYLGCL